MRAIFPTLVAALAVLPAAAQQVRDFAFEVESLGGQTLRHTDFEKSVLVVDYWGTWCPPCRDAVPVLQKMYAKYKHHGLEIVGLTYERGGGDPADAVRTFAEKNGVTYHLALGTPALQAQVPGFRGYPTILFFGRGLAFDHLEVGFSPAHEAKMEAWIRGALGLEPAGTADEPADAEEPAGPKPAADEPPPLPPGTIFKPGDGDTGFDFEVTDADGKTLRFADLRGKPVVLALTSTWDGEAVKTATLLQELHEKYGDRAQVIAASLEIDRQEAKKLAAIVRFRSEHKLEYPVFPAGLGFQKKIHLFSGMPLFLAFDAKGTLVLREGGATEDLKQKIEACVDGLLN
jgi:thiol-disulfide isomerase/thioredoxin